MKMPPYMSYSITTQQFLEDLKILTRRLGWANLKMGDRYTAVKKVRGLKHGEKITILGDCICISNVPEPLDEIIRRPYRYDDGKSEMELEGFPSMTAEQFVTFFCKHMKITPTTVVNRIEFKRIPVAEPYNITKQLTLGV